jgi:hypothetical protein
MSSRPNQYDTPTEAVIVAFGEKEGKMIPDGSC